MLFTGGEGGVPSERHARHTEVPEPIGPPPQRARDVGTPCKLDPLASRACMSLLLRQHGAAALTRSVSQCVSVVQFSVFFEDVTGASHGGLASQLAGHSELGLGFRVYRISGLGFRV